MSLPDDYRKGIYTDGNIIATVDVRWSRDEILMHDETNDRAFTLTPHELSLWERVDTKVGDGLDIERIQKRIKEGDNYGI